MTKSTPDTCSQLEQMAEPTAGVKPSGHGCQECLKSGDAWVHLRLCLACGHVGCCDDSPNRHATKHFHHTQHPVIRSFEPGEDWGYCFVDEQSLETLPAQPGEAARRHFASPTAT